MNASEISILSSIKNNTQQSMMRKKDLSQTTNLDSKFASTLYYFLVGKINYLPNIEILEGLVANGETAISMGCGVLVYYRNKELIVEVEDMITDDKLRRDTISSDFHFAITRNLIDSGDHGGISNVDIEKNPKYSPKRVEYLQNYLAQFKELKQEQGQGRHL